MSGFEKFSLIPHDTSQLKTYNYIISLHNRIIQTKNDAIRLLFTALFRILFAITVAVFISGLSLFIVFLVQFQMLPVMLHTFPIHLQHSNCRTDATDCSYPSATISFLHGKTGKEGPLLMAGQKYSMTVELDLPESEVDKRNAALGTFMVRIDLRTVDALSKSTGDYAKLIHTSSRAGTLQYRSSLHRALRIAFFLPLYLTGYLEERQKLKLPLIPSYQEDPYSPVTEAVIQVEKFTVDIYQAKLLVEAHLEGVRYYMQKYPVTIGSCLAVLNFFCGMVLIGFSAYHRLTRKNPTKVQAVATAPDDLDWDDGDGDLSSPDSFDPLEAVDDDSDDVLPKSSTGSVLYHRKLK